jgi:hypothetical protein
MGNVSSHSSDQGGVMKQCICAGLTAVVLLCGVAQAFAQSPPPKPGRLAPSVASAQQVPLAAASADAKSVACNDMVIDGEPILDKTIDIMLSIANATLHKDGMPDIDRTSCQYVADIDPEGKSSSFFHFSNIYFVSIDINNTDGDRTVVVNDIPANRHQFYCWSSKDKSITTGQCGQSQIKQTTKIRPDQDQSP